MAHHMQLILALTLSLMAPAAASAGTKTVLAVANFKNTTGEAEHDLYGGALAQMMLTDIVTTDQFSVVERHQLHHVQKELALQNTDFIDPATAQKVGRGVGATHIILGDFAIVGDSMRINARLVNVQSTEITVASKVVGDKSAIFELEAELASKLVSKIGGKLTSRKDVSKAEAWETFDGFARALRVYEDFLKMYYQGRILDDMYELAILRCMRDGEQDAAYTVSLDGHKYSRHLTNILASSATAPTTLTRSYFRQLREGITEMGSSYGVGMDALKARDMKQWQTIHDAGERSFRNFTGLDMGGAEGADSISYKVGYDLGMDLIQRLFKMGYSKEKVMAAHDPIKKVFDVYHGAYEEMRFTLKEPGEWIGTSCPTEPMVGPGSIFW